MKKIRASLLRLVLVLGLVLMGAQAAGAYELTYVGNGFVASAQVPGDGPYNNYGEGYAGAIASVDPMSATGWGDWWTNTPNQIGVEVWGETGATSPGLSGSASASAVTRNDPLDPLNPPPPTGIYFQLTGGTPGEAVTINYSWSAYVETGTGGTATLNGGSTGMYISVNDSHIRDIDERSVGSNQLRTDFTDSGTFTAHVNDIIGINLAASANIDFSGEGDFFAKAHNSMQLEAVPLPPSVLLLGSGLLGLLALGGSRPRRQ